MLLKYVVFTLLTVVCFVCFYSQRFFRLDRAVFKFKVGYLINHNLLKFAGQSNMRFKIFKYRIR